MKVLRLFVVAAMLLSFGISVAYAMPADEKPAAGEKTKKAKKKVEKKPESPKKDQPQK